LKGAPISRNPKITRWLKSNDTTIEATATSPSRKKDQHNFWKKEGQKQHMKDME
jgi:hypothetical protein